ncbi:MAG: exosortase system-associated protein, TIGR04073 family [Candidatus Omnitrophota bacterium]
MFKHSLCKKVVVLFVISLMLGMAMPSYADSSMSPANSNNAGGKLRRGLANFATGWVEIPIAMDKAIKESNPVFGVVVGTVKGTVKGIVRTAAGVFDTVTFPVPPYSKTWITPEFIGQPTN